MQSYASNAGSSDWQVGNVIAGKFRIERVLAGGAMGIVLGATDLVLDRTVAIKVLRTSIQARSQQEAAARLLREAKAAARLGSEHIAHVLEVGSSESGLPYIVMEYLQGRTLYEILDAEGPLDVATVAEYAIHACEGLMEVHALGIVHRDIKPENLFVVERAGWPAIKILDFGIAKLPAGDEPADPAEQLIMGTPGYISPEQLRSTATVDHRADIWSLGATLYELVAGKAAFGDACTLPEVMASILNDPAPRLDETRPDVPEGFAAIVDRCLRKDRDVRFSSAAEVARALVKFAPLRAHSVVERTASIPPPASRSQRSRSEQAPASRAAVLHHPIVDIRRLSSAPPAAPSAPPAAPEPAESPALVALEPATVPPALALEADTAHPSGEFMIIDSIDDLEVLESEPATGFESISVTVEPDPALIAPSTPAAPSDDPAPAEALLEPVAAAGPSPAEPLPESVALSESSESGAVSGASPEPAGEPVPPAADTDPAPESSEAAAPAPTTQPAFPSVESATADSAAVDSAAAASAPPEAVSESREQEPAAVNAAPTAVALLGAASSASSTVERGDPTPLAIITSIPPASSAPVSVFAVAAPSEPVRAHPARSSGRRRRAVAALAVPMLVALGLVARHQRQPAAATAPEPVPVTPSTWTAAPASAKTVELIVRATPSSTELRIDGMPVSNPYRGRPVADALSHRIEAVANGFITERQLVSFAQDASVEFTLSPLAVSVAPLPAPPSSVPVASPSVPVASPSGRAAPPTPVAPPTAPAPPPSAPASADTKPPRPVPPGHDIASSIERLAAAPSATSVAPLSRFTPAPVPTAALDAAARR